MSQQELNASDERGIAAVREKAEVNISHRAVVWCKTAGEDLCAVGNRFSWQHLRKPGHTGRNHVDRRPPGIITNGLDSHFTLN